MLRELKLSGLKAQEPCSPNWFAVVIIFYVQGKVQKIKLFFQQNIYNSRTESDPLLLICEDLT